MTYILIAMATVLYLLCNIQGELGDLSLFILKKRRQRQSLIALLNYLWCSFRENGARLLVVLGNERSDIRHNLQETLGTTCRKGCSDQRKRGEKINESGTALEGVHQRGCRGTQMCLDPWQSDLTKS